MRGAIVCNGFLRGAKFSEPVSMLIDAAGRKGVRLDAYLNTDLCLPVGDPSLARTLGDPDFAVFWDKDVRLAENMELCGIRLYNTSGCIAACDDKAATHLALARHRVPSIPTVSVPMTFEGVGYGGIAGTGLRLLERFGFPMVAKDCHGSFGQQVSLLRDEEDLLGILRDERPRILQPYIECGSTDYRLEVVGGEVVAAMEMKGRTGDFRSNVTSGGSMRPHRPTEREADLAVGACEAVGADFAGVDILYSDGEPLVCEINSNAHIRNLADCTGINVSDSMIEHIVKDIGS